MGADSAAETIDGTPRGVAAVSPATSFLSMSKTTWNDLCVDLRFANAVLFPKPAWGYVQNEPGHEVKQASGYLRAAPAAAKAWWHLLFGDSRKGDRRPSPRAPSQTMKKQKKQQRSAAHRAPTNPVDIDDLDAIIRETEAQPYFLDAPQRWQKNRHGRAGKKGPCRAAPFKRALDAAAQATGNAGIIANVPQEPSRYARALKSYEQFHELPEGTATIDQVRESAAGIEGWAQTRLGFGGASPERNPYHVTASGGGARGCSDIGGESGDASENVVNFIPDVLRQTEEVFDAELSMSDMGTCLLNATAAADDAWASICPKWGSRAPLTVAYFNVLAHRVCTGRGHVSFPQLEFERRQRWSNLLRSGACRVCLEVSPVAGMSGHAFTVRFPRMTHEPEVEIVDDGNVNERIATTLTTFVQSVERTSVRFFTITYSSEIIRMDFGDPYSIEVAGDEGDMEDEDTAPRDFPDESIEEAAAREEPVAESQVPRKRQKREGESTTDLLAAYDQGGEEARTTMRKSVQQRGDSIQSLTDAWRTLVAASYRELGSDVRRVLIAAMALHRCRPCDVGLREHCLLLHILLGGDVLRAHNGVLYMYCDGSWRPFEGLISEGVLAICRRSFLQVEGVFLQMHKWQPMADAAFVEQFKGIRSRFQGSDEDFLHHCEGRASRSISGQGRYQEADPGAAREEQEEGAVAGGVDGPPGEAVEEQLEQGPFFAKMVQRISVTLQRELLGTKIIKHYAEWCSSPRQASSGACFGDACLIFDASGRVTSVDKTPCQNVYIHIPHNLHDPVLSDARQTVKRFLSSTFWGNSHALDCQLAAMCLVLQGMNIDRCFWTVGPGGVGQSLLTHLIDNAFSGLHAFLDTNVYYDDHELRKQAETLVHKLITTGQEAVENSKHGFREDLYKKHISADPIAARLPYGIVTHLVSLYGWKRLELNKLIKFTGVTLPSVDSIHRRTWVVILKAKFLSPELVATIPNASDQGIFCKDPKLKDVLKSAPAALALWQILHGFMRKHTKDDSLQIIEDYAEVRDGQTNP